MSQLFKRFFGDKFNRFNESNGPTFKRCFGRLLVWLGYGGLLPNEESHESVLAKVGWTFAICYTRI